MTIISFVSTLSSGFINSSEEEMLLNLERSTEKGDFSTRSQYLVFDL